MHALEGRAGDAVASRHASAAALHAGGRKLCTPFVEDEAFVAALGPRQSQREHCWTRPQTGDRQVREIKIVEPQRRRTEHLAFFDDLIGQFDARRQPPRDRVKREERKGALRGIGADAESIRDEKVKVFKSIPPLSPQNVVRGQFRGYRNEKGVAPGSQVETFAALRLEIDSWRWKGVPVFIRAGKCLPLTCTEVYVELDLPPALDDAGLAANHWRFRVTPEMSIALGAMVKTPGEKMAGQSIELMLSHDPQGDEMDAYERLLGDALRGDATLFAREDSVEACWRIVEPVLGQKVAVEPYEPGTWGPNTAQASLTPPGGWHNPVAT